MDKEIQTDLLLEFDDTVNFLLDEVLVLLRRDFLLGQLLTGGTNFLRLLSRIISICVYNRDA